MYEEVIEKINTADYEDAYKLIVDIKKKSSNYDGELAILEAETCYQIQAGDVPCNRQGNTD